MLSSNELKFEKLVMFKPTDNLLYFSVFFRRLFSAKFAILILVISRAITKKPVISPEWFFLGVTFWESQMVFPDLFIIGNSNSG